MILSSQAQTMAACIRARRCIPSALLTGSVLGRHCSADLLLIVILGSQHFPFSERRCK
jgi:hypothetical protein